MEQTVEERIDRIINTEGGYINHPHDRGGPTKYGITAAKLAEYTGKAAGVAEVKAITKELAYEIYLNDFYLKPKINTLPPELQMQVLDWAVNSGPGRPIRAMQRVLNTYLVDKIQVDGDIGPKTLKALSETLADKTGFRTLNNAIAVRRLKFYARIVKFDRSQGDYIEGWVNRATEFIH